MSRNEGPPVKPGFPPGLKPGAGPGGRHPGEHRRRPVHGTGSELLDETGSGQREQAGWRSRQRANGPSGTYIRYTFLSDSWRESSLCPTRRWNSSAALCRGQGMTLITCRARRQLALDRQTAICALVFTASFSRTCSRWPSTVGSAMKRRPAIWRLVRPAATSFTISSSPDVIRRPGIIRVRWIPGWV